MKITIDTKEDSHEDMRKVMAMLSAFMGKKQISSTIANPINTIDVPVEKPKPSGFMDMFSDPEPKKEEVPSLFNMFDQPKETTTKNIPQQDSPDLFNMFNTNKETAQDLLNNEKRDDNNQKVLTY